MVSGEHMRHSMDTAGRTQLMTAAAAGQLDAVAAALAHQDSQVNAQDRFGFTALMKAAAAGHAHIVRLLVKAGAELDTRDRAGSTALTRAVVGDHALVVEALLEAGAGIAAPSADKSRKTLLHIAAERGHEGVILQLIHAGASLEARYWDDATPLLLAADTDHPAAVRALIKAGADIEAVDKLHRTALLRAAAHGHSVAVQMLLNHGANIQVCNSEGCSALILAAAKGHKTTAACLVTNGAEINAVSRSRGHTALMAAAEKDGYEELVKMLLDHGADRSLRDHDQQTAADLTTNGRIKKLLRLPLLQRRSNRVSLESQRRSSDMQPEPEVQPLEMPSRPNKPNYEGESLEELCNGMEETAFICKRIHDRLTFVQEHVLIATDPDQQYQHVMSSFRSFLGLNVGKHPIVRLMCHEKNLKTCYDLHREIDNIQLGFSFCEINLNWKSQWAIDAKTLRELFVRALRECKMPENGGENEESWREVLKLLSLESNQCANPEERYLMHKYLQHAARLPQVNSSAVNARVLQNRAQHFHIAVSNNCTLANLS